ncbi:hypothetical protein [Hafnia psychrotolerans]|uniref:Uncharacterized protein n=1 Tax=Hafnia psychrotolerans TaxID=1477018 RepID=A0ABQ1GH59_9GAMM|nr:hypothetical protein GCM10011328_18440 [Hafnia psychrotolerans]
MANTTVVMLGTGTFVTQAAMCEFARAGVLVTRLRGLSMSVRAGINDNGFNGACHGRPIRLIYWSGSQRGIWLVE